MKRRDFIKTGICLGCAGAVGAGFCLMQNNKPLSEDQIAELSQKFIYKSEEELPKYLRIDVCNLCQLNCPVCWVRENEERIKKEAGGFGYLPFKTFKNFVDNHPFIKTIEMAHSGEVFLNPELIDIFRYAYEKNIILTADDGTNMNYLPDKVAEALVKYKVRYVVVSIDAATPETYKIYRRGGDFNTVINNIKKINKYKEKYNSEFPKLLYKFILFGHNEHEILAAKQLAKELNMDIGYTRNCVETYSPLKNPKKVLAETGLKPEGIKFSNITNFLFDKNNMDSAYLCSTLFESPQINFNGDLFGCNHNFIESYKINVFEEGLLKALNNKKVLYSKLMLTNTAVPSRSDNPCSCCLLYDHIKTKNKPLKYGV